MDLNNPENNSIHVLLSDGYGSPTILFLSLSLFPKCFCVTSNDLPTE